MRGKAQTGSDRSSVTTDGVSCKAFPRGPLGRRNRATETVDSGLIAGPIGASSEWVGADHEQSEVPEGVAQVSLTVRR